jgi:hypothetical protein
MCDYSLHHVASRPAKVDDKLVVTKFSNSITRGFATAGEPNVAVCLLPGLIQRAPVLRDLGLPVVALRAPRFLKGAT